MAVTKPRPVVNSISLPIEVGKNVSDSFTKEVQKELKTIPDHIKHKLATYGYKIVVCRMLVDEYPDLKEERPRGWEHGTWLNSDGIHLPLEKEITVAEKFMYYYTGLLTNSRNPGNILRHEIGHAIDVVFDKPFTCLSGTRAFKLAYAKDKKYIESLKSWVKVKFSYLLQRGDGGRKEAFAETCAKLLGGGIHTLVSSNYFLKCFSNVREFICDKALAI